MKRPIFLTSFFSIKFNGSKFLTSAAIWQANLVGSKPVMRPTPLLPAMTESHTSLVVLPTPQIRPMPVTTTLRPKFICHLSCVCGGSPSVLVSCGTLGSSSSPQPESRHQRLLHNP